MTALDVFAELALLRQRADVRNRRRALALRNRIVVDNLGLVHGIVRHQFFATPEMTYEDLVHEGVLGLMIAVERFDHQRGIKFSTYATYWIRHAVGRALQERGRLVRLPVHIWTAAGQARRGARPGATDEDRARAARISPHAAERALAAVAAPVFSLDERGVFGNAEWLDAWSTPADVAASAAQSIETETDADAIDRQMDARTLAARALRHLAELPAREQAVLRARFGLDNDNCSTLKMVGAGLDLSRERIRQIEVRALLKLRKAMKEDWPMPEIESIVDTDNGTHNNGGDAQRAAASDGGGTPACAQAEVLAPAIAPGALAQAVAHFDAARAELRLAETAAVKAADRVTIARAVFTRAREEVRVLLGDDDGSTRAAQTTSAAGRTAGTGAQATAALKAKASAAPRPDGDVEHRILAHLKAVPQAGVKTLAVAIGAPPAAVAAAAKVLLGSGRLRWRGRGLALK